MIENELHFQVLTLEPTQGCNQKCITCHNWENSQNDSINSYSPELTIESYGKLIREATVLGVKHVNLSGGEPFVRKDVTKIVQLIKSYGLECSLVTNGTSLTYEAIKELVDMRVEAIRISVDAAMPDLHDKIRGQNGAFSRVHKHIKSLQQYGGQVGFLPDLSFNSTISRINLGEIPGLIQLAYDWGATTVNYGFVIRVGQEAIRRTNERIGFDVTSEQFAGGENDKLLLTLEDVPSAIMLLESANDSAQRLGVRNNIPVLMDYLRDPQAVVTGKYTQSVYDSSKCSVPYIRILVNPYGIVSPCSSVRINLGNVSTEPLDEIWFGDSYNRFRRDIEENSLFPICQSCCNLNRRGK